MGVDSSRQHRAGSLFATIAVPNYVRGGFAMSELAVGRRGDATPVVGEDRVSPLNLPFLPTTDRELRCDDEALFFVRVHTTQRSPLRFTTEVRTETGDLVVQSSESRDHPSPGSPHAAFDYVSRVPVAGLEPGRYQVTVSVRSEPQQDSVPTSRSTFIRVLPPSATSDRPSEYRVP